MGWNFNKSQCQDPQLMLYVDHYTDIMKVSIDNYEYSKSIFTYNR